MVLHNAYGYAFTPAQQGTFSPQATQWVNGGSTSARYDSPSHARENGLGEPFSPEVPSLYKRPACTFNPKVAGSIPARPIGRAGVSSSVATHVTYEGAYARAC